MKGLFAALVLALFTFARAQEDINGNADFEALQADGKHAFVKYYAPWCGHCKRLAPTWADLGKEFHGSDKVRIAKVDCTKHKDLCSQQGVRGYPTLKFYKGGAGEGEKYAGRRELDDFKTFIKSFD